MTKNLTYITLSQFNITDFAKARNIKLNKVKTDWVFFVDKDELITKKLKKEIVEAVKDKKFNYQVKRLDWFLNKKLKFGETANVRFTRLIQKGTGQWQARVHETFQSDLPLKTLKHSLIHKRDITISQFIDRLNFYSSLAAKELNKFNLFQLLFYPSLKFIQNYILRLGFLDGVPGLTMAFMMSLHSLIVRIKSYELKKT